MKKGKGAFWLVRTLCLLCALAIGFATTIATTSSDDDDDFIQTILEGRFLDTAVIGLGYTAGSDEGVTDGKGGFTYLKDNEIQFYIGGIKIGSAILTKKIITPVDVIVGALDYTDEEVTNILRFLQSIDADQDLSNGIQINSDMRANAAGLTLDFSEPDFTNNAQNIIDQIFSGSAPGTYPLVDAATAQKHFRETLAGMSSVVLSRDALGVPLINGSNKASYYDIFSAMGYAVAEDRLWQIETFRRTSNGTLSEIFGNTQLASDIAMRTTGYTQQELEDAFAAMSEEAQIVLKGYVNGINTRIDEILDDPTLLPFEFANVPGGQFNPAYWDVYDVMVWAAIMQRNFDPEARGMTGQIDNLALYGELTTVYGGPTGTTMFDDLRWDGCDPDALTYIPGAAPAARKSGGDQGVDGVLDDSVDYAALAKKMRERQEQITENLKSINAFIKMGSYAWVVDGTKTESGNPIIYSGPQMGFSVPSIIAEASIKAADLNISGMFVPGIPSIVIGRTPHHAWSMQVGHAHTVDYYAETAQDVVMTRTEVINVLGEAPTEIVVARTANGPVVNEVPMLSWRYSHWGRELDIVAPLLGVAKATSMDEFGDAIDLMCLSQHFCYADVDGNIAYWMSGRDPVRPAGEWRFPQGTMAAPLDYDLDVLKDRSTDRNTDQHYYCGWNNKSSATYSSTFNNFSYFFGPFHRAHVVDEYLANNDNLTFEDVRDLALNIATTSSFGSGGNPWAFVDEEFTAAVDAYNAITPTQVFTDAITLLEGWDGHFVDGGQAEWAEGEDRADAWMLMDAWIREVIRLTFEDEFTPDTYDAQSTTLLFNVILHSFPGSSIQTQYNWFQNLADPSAPQTFDDIVVEALDTVLADLGAKPWGTGERGEIEYFHTLISQVTGQPVWTTPFSSRSTYAHVVEYSQAGPVRVESMFPLGPSGNIDLNMQFDPFFFSLTTNYDAFAPRDFPVPQ